MKNLKKKCTSQQPDISITIIYDFPVFSMLKVEMTGHFKPMGSKYFDI